MPRGDDPTEHEEAQPGTGISAGMVVGVVLGGALALFVGQNTQDTTVTWLVFEAEQPLWVVLLATAAATLVATELIGGARRRRKRKQAARSNRP